MKRQFLWDEAARADLRRIDRDTAMRILLALTRYRDTGEGDVKPLTDRDGLYRLRLANGEFFQSRYPGYHPHFTV